MTPRHPLATQPDYRLYESLKAEWASAQIEATPEEYTAAIRVIAKECGV